MPFPFGFTLICLLISTTVCIWASTPTPKLASTLALTLAPIPKLATSNITDASANITKTSGDSTSPSLAHTLPASTIMAVSKTSTLPASTSVSRALA